MKVLFVCSANVDRSPTAEKVIRETYPDIETKSAGTSYYANAYLNKEFLQWADVVLCMEDWQVKFIQRKFRELMTGKIIDCLNIPDKYEYMDSWLVSKVESSFNEWFSKLTDQVKMDLIKEGGKNGEEEK